MLNRLIYLKPYNIISNDISSNYFFFLNLMLDYLKSDANQYNILNCLKSDEIIFH